MQRLTFFILVATFIASVGFCPGCKQSEYAQQADRSAYTTLEIASQNSIGTSKSYAIDYDPYKAQSQPASQPASAPATGPASASQPASQPAVMSIQLGQKTVFIGDEGELCVISLQEAVQIAFRNSRSFQTRREQLYTQALAVANGRRGWEPARFGGDTNASAGRVVTSNVDVDSGAATPGVTVFKRLMSGGQIALGTGLNYATDFSGFGNSSLASLLQGNITQPLLRGAWRDLAYESQYRLERNLLLSVYEFDRYNQTFAADIVTRYWSVLRRRDRLRNEQANINRLKQTLALTRVLVEGGVRSPLELDQAQQDQLSAQIRYQVDVQEYADMLDQFKLLLGMPVQARLELDDVELERLTQKGPEPVEIDERLAVQAALAWRPDVLSQAAALRDAARNVEIAADKFNPQLDLTLGARAGSREPRDFLNVQYNDHTRTSLMTLDYNLDQTDNRDAYRNAIVAKHKSARDMQELLDNVSLQVRQAYRRLEQARQSHQLQQKNIQIARRRQKLAMLQQKNGEVAARDVLDAEESLRNAQNGLTDSLISYTSTRVQFLATMGMIEVDDRGQLNERKRPDNSDRIERIYPYLGQRP